MSRIEGTSSTTSTSVVDGPVAPAPLSISARVMALRSASRQDRLEGARSDMRSAEASRQAQIDARLEAMRRAEEAQGDAGFWGNVADVLKVVAAVAAIVVGVAGTIFTAGASGAVAAIAFALLTATTVAAPYAGDLVADATNMSPTQRMILAIGVAVVCFAAAIFNPGAAATSATNIATAGTRISAAGAQLTAITQRLGQCVALLTQFTNGYSTTMGGLAAIEEGAAQADAQRHEAESTRAGQWRDDAGDALEDISREGLRAARQVMQTVEIEDEMTQAALRA